MDAAEPRIFLKYTTKKWEKSGLVGVLEKKFFKQYLNAITTYIFYGVLQWSVNSRLDKLFSVLTNWNRSCIVLKLDSSIWMSLLAKFFPFLKDT